MFTILLPMRMVESSLSYFSAIASTRAAEVIAVLGAAFQADLIQGRKCGLGAEKKAENTTNTTSATQSVILPSSIKRGITLNFLF